jgi:hypothetical protein
MYSQVPNKGERSTWRPFGPELKAEGISTGPPDFINGTLALIQL